MTSKPHPPLPHVSKPSNIKDLGPIDIAQLKSLVLKLSENVWNRENESKENKYFCFHHTRHIVFRFITANQDPRKGYSNPIWQVWKPQLLPIFEAACSSYGFQNPFYPKVMLARLAAGHVIDRHVDGAGSNLLTHKIHIPIQTNPLALFHSENDSYYLEEGRAYEVNNVKAHGVENLGQEDRIHLIFEVFDNA
ncbi:aspartyl/asparaginyl beta-hydroxylase domain-containing protein [Pelagicoccus sp. SDUM812003]|uniref:aspartyl/asparaginyl beta-hydroxylase domain-containing protein n=1 Tax=Pelagicoccus sp. SDUM812003 TaxID=3041267 RepID=UPI00280C5046|nr:aspartyl/asparaginyl beta-hydroxylase domain-containing protein [Pelagicoccus sp. SDUM812003]MDQ8205647.1 aspartyl/asparaginyl beta-hydroxylase domain-containing protein [Pelagicoccus sp. SDUM812003]